MHACKMGLEGIVSKCLGSTYRSGNPSAYECRVCGSVIYHMHDKNDYAPFWYFTDKRP